MRKTATKMLILGAAVLALFGAAMTIKSGYATSEATPSLTEEQQAELNASVGKLFEQARAALEAAGVPHTDSEAQLESGHTAALGQSVTVGSKGVNLGPWLVIILGLAAGISLVFVSVNHQYAPATRQSKVSKMVDDIVAKNTARRSQAQSSRPQSRRQAAKARQQDHEFDDITRAVDEIIAKHQSES